MEKFKVKIHTWYQERGGIEQEELLPFNHDGFDHIDDALIWFNDNKEYYIEMYPITKIDFGQFEDKPEAKLMKKEQGDTVYMDCLSSMGASSAGDIKITKTKYKYDENTGEKYKVIIVEGGAKFDSRNGEPLNKQSMYYIV